MSGRPSGERGHRHEPRATLALVGAIELRAQTADTAARSLKEAETELEKLTRSGYRTVVTWSTKAEGERA